MSDRRTQDMPDRVPGAPALADDALDLLVKNAWDRERMPEGLAAATLDFIHRSAQERGEERRPALHLVDGPAQTPPAASPSAPSTPSAPARRRRRRPPMRRIAQLLAACLVVGALAAGSFALAAETAQVHVDGGGSIELGLNRWGRVVRAESSDPDLDGALDDLGVVGMSCADALEALSSDDEVNQSLSSDGEAVVLTVSCDDEGQLDATIIDCEGAAAGFGHGAMCMAADGETRAAAQESGMGLGRYSVYLEIQALDPNITLDDCRNLSMRELRDLLAEVQAEAEHADGGSQDQSHGTTASPASDAAASGETTSGEVAPEGGTSSEGQCQNGGHGRGSGNGHGKGMGGGRGMMGGGSSS